MVEQEQENGPAGASSGDDEPIKVGVQPTSPPAQRTGERPMLRVLIVDDDPDTAQSLCQLVRLWGHDARTACCGKAALAEAAAFAPQVALLDVVMPGMSGLELAERLRHAPAPPLLVALSGYAWPCDHDAALRAGFDRFLAKPYDLDELRRLIGEADAGEPSAKPAGVTSPAAEPPR
jgi:CheY-like chemotaxis protein